MPQNYEDVRWFLQFAQTFSHIRAVKVTPGLPIGRSKPHEYWSASRLSELWQTLCDSMTSGVHYRVLTELVDRSRFVQAYKAFRANPADFLPAVVKPNGFIHPYFGLSHRWDVTDAVTQGPELSERLANRAFVATAIAFKKGLHVLAQQPIIDLNALITAEIAAVQEPTRGP